MNEVVIDIQRSGFPIKIGEVSRWFDTSAEALVRFFDLEEEATKRLNEFEKQVIESNIGKDIEEKQVTIETAQRAVELEKTFLGIQYDLLFGDGTFEELYRHYPDYLILQEVLENVSELIAKKLDELSIEREKLAKKRIGRYTSKTKTARQNKK